VPAPVLAGFDETPALCLALGVLELLWKVFLISNPRGGLNLLELSGLFSAAGLYTFFRVYVSPGAIESQPTSDGGRWELLMTLWASVPVGLFSTPFSE